MNISSSIIKEQQTALKQYAPTLLFITVFGFLFTDLTTEQLLGTIARCPNLFTAPLVFLVIQAFTKKTQSIKLASYMLQYSIITTFTAVLMLIITVVFVTTGGWYAYTEFMPVKLIKAASYNFLNALTIYNLYVLCRHITIQQLYKILFFCLTVLTVYGYVEIMIAYPIPGIHGTIVPFEGKRLQLTTAEPVTATILYATFLSLVLYLRSYLQKNNITTFLLGIIGIALLLIIGSKGGVILLVLAIIMSMRKKINFRILALGLLAILPIIYVIIENIIPLIAVDIENFTSFSTRATTWVASFVSLIHYPFGEGLGSYLVYFPPLMIPTCHWLSSILGIPLNTAEMDNYILIGKYLGAKAGMPQEILLSGVTAIIYIFLICRYQVRQLKKLASHSSNVFFSFIFYFLFMEFMFIVTFETMYFIFLPIMVIDKILDVSLENGQITD